MSDLHTQATSMQQKEPISWVLAGRAPFPVWYHPSSPQGRCKMFSRRQTIILKSTNATQKKQQHSIINITFLSYHMLLKCHIAQPCMYSAQKN